jgi:putative membrane protein
MTTLLAFSAHPAGWHDGPGLWVLVPVTFWLAVITAVVTLWWRRRPVPGPEVTLGEAFARGDITEADYRARLAVLREARRRGRR